MYGLSSWHENKDFYPDKKNIKNDAISKNEFQEKTVFSNFPNFPRVFRKFCSGGWILREILHRKRIFQDFF